MNERLAVHTVVQAPPGSVVAYQAFGPDDTDIPDWALDQIGEQCFVGGKKPSAGKKSAKRSDGDSGDTSGDAGFDPGDHTVADVNDHLADADDAERARVLQAESGGKARAGIVNGPHANQSGD